MIRIVVTQFVLFLLPFVGYFVYRLATTGGTGQAIASMRWPWFALTLCGAAFVIAGFLWFGVTGQGGGGGAYVPAHTEDGRLVPGQFVPSQ